MPETDQPGNQPGDPSAEPQAAAKAAARKGTRKRKAQADVLAALRTKYRLDDNVRIEAKVDGRPLGLGPLMAPGTFNRLASVDPTPDKRCLDWMLYQAGGGSEALDRSRKRWGIGTKEQLPEKIIEEFRQDPMGEALRNLTVENINEIIGTCEKKSIRVPQLRQILDPINRVLRIDDMPARYEAMKRFLAESPDLHLKEDQVKSVAGELVSYRMKSWTRKQETVIVRDRVHLLFVWNKLFVGVDMATAEEVWRRTEPARVREYTFGDEDSLRGTLEGKKYFGFARYWPGKDGIYERVSQAMSLWLRNISKVERRNASLAQVNAEITQRNQQLPPGQEPESLRQPLAISTDIGYVELTKDMRLIYKGAYNTIDDLANAVKAMENLPIMTDVRFMGPEGEVSPGEKLFSDDNLDLLMPLTLAASVQAGHPAWSISNPSQFGQATSPHSYGRLIPWTQMHIGTSEGDFLDAYGGLNVATFQEYMGFAAMVHVKKLVPKARQRILVTGKINELVKLAPPFIPLRFQVGDGREITFSTLAKSWERDFPEIEPGKNASAGTLLGRSLSHALHALKKWGTWYDPARVVADPVAYLAAQADKYHQRPSSRRTEEQISERARQVVDVLTT